jgi:hypothetical protein
MQNESNTIKAAFEEPAYTQTTNSRKKNPFHSEDIRLVKDKKNDVTMKISSTQEQPSRGKLYIIKKKPKL